MNLEAETILRLVGLLLALAIAVGGLRSHLRWKRRSDAGEASARRERKTDEKNGGPWGGG